MFNFLQNKKMIKASFTKDGKRANIVIGTKLTPMNLMYLLYYMTKHAAPALKMEHRQLLNKLVDFDKNIERAKRDEEKAKRYGK